MTTLDALARDVVSGNATAWTALQLQVISRVEVIARKHQGLRRRGLHLLPDDLAELKAATLERLWRNEFASMRRYFDVVDAQRGELQSFESWLYGAVDFTIREHLRRRFGRAPRTGRESACQQPSKRDINTNAGALDDGAEVFALVESPRMTRKLAARAIMEHVDQVFTAEEREALRLHHLEDLDLTEIARRLGLVDARAADKLIRRLHARLRYHFGADGGS